MIPHFSYLLHKNFSQRCVKSALGLGEVWVGWEGIGGLGLELAGCAGRDRWLGLDVNAEKDCATSTQPKMLLYWGLSRTSCGF